MSIETLNMILRTFYPAGDYAFISSSEKIAVHNASFQSDTPDMEISLVKGIATLEHYTGTTTDAENVGEVVAFLKENRFRGCPFFANLV